MCGAQRRPVVISRAARMELGADDLEVQRHALHAAASALETSAGMLRRAATSMRGCGLATRARGLERRADSARKHGLELREAAQRHGHTQRAPKRARAPTRPRAPSRPRSASDVQREVLAGQAAAMRRRQGVRAPDTLGMLSDHADPVALAYAASSAHFRSGGVQVAWQPPQQRRPPPLSSASGRPRRELAEAPFRGGAVPSLPPAPPPSANTTTNEDEQEDEMLAPGPPEAVDLREQELWGPPPEPPAWLAAVAAGLSDAEQDADDRVTCVVCLDARANTLLLPCSHQVMCGACADILMARLGRRCPTCRATVEEVCK